MIVSGYDSWIQTWNLTAVTIRGMNERPNRNLPPRPRGEKGLVDYQRWMQGKRPLDGPQNPLPGTAWVDSLTRRGVVVPRPDAVASFAGRYPDVPPVLDHPLSLVGRYFPDAYQIVVDTFDEAEGQTGPEYQSLLMTIEMNPPVRDALDRLDRFDREWWYALPPEIAVRVGSHLHFI